ncbi:MAG: hypothetical protein HY054_07115 [Proteobacteria bacterium]|nr:hypothetical protein [Pseudomonadota bacterium]
MNRFIALVWNWRADHAVADAAALVAGVERERPGWKRVWDKPGLIVFEGKRQGAGDGALEVGEGALFVGTVFDASGRIANPASIDVARLRATTGAAAFTELWGRYVAFVRDEDEACVHVVRDPSGALPCFTGRRGWIFVFFSNPDDISALDLDGTEIDRTYLAQRLVNNRVVTSRTGLEGVSVLAPGAIARVGQGRCVIRQAWTAEAVASSAPKTEASEAIVLLREGVELACAAWAGRFEKVGLRLSGGLDSSIVLAAIAGKTQIGAINFVTPNAEGDERDFARAAAVFAGAALSERLRDSDRVDLEEAVRHPPTLNPHLWLADGETDEVEAAFAREQGVDAYLSGRGGDNVFFRSEQPGALADWLATHGAGPSFWRRAWAYASETGAPFIAAVGAAMRLASSPPAGTPAPVLPWLSQRAIELAHETPHAPALLPPGKLMHVHSIGDRLNYFDYRAHADYIYPLVSQPVIETCLRLPTYMLSPAGADRGLARAAFAPKLAPAVLARRSKGRTNVYLARILMRHVPFLQRFLLDGELAASGLIERDALAAALTEGALMRSMEVMAHVAGLLCIEAWLRNPPCASVKKQAASALVT